MKWRDLGSSGLKVSAIGLGCNNFGVIPDEDARHVIRKALDLGVNFFDTADTYGEGRSEGILGRVFGSERRQLVLATKFGHPASAPPGTRPGSRAHICSAIEASLKRLRTEWIDLYQIHFPDPSTPIEETLRALEHLVREGKIRYIGCSNFDAWLMVDAL
jgi:aryl-alcohol dehydrogenase-like predicted oxidoreductase